MPVLTANKAQEGWVMIEDEIKRRQRTESQSICKILSLAILNTLAHEFNTIPHPVQVRIYYKHQTAVGHTLRQQSIEAKCQLLVTCGHQARVAFPKGPDDGVLPM